LAFGKDELSRWLPLASVLGRHEIRLEEGLFDAVPPLVNVPTGAVVPHLHNPRPDRRWLGVDVDRVGQVDDWICKGLVCQKVRGGIVEAFRQGNRMGRPTSVEFAAPEMCRRLTASS
jgi:hypothetical protein